LTIQTSQIIVLLSFAIFGERKESKLNFSNDVFLDLKKDMPLNENKIKKEAAEFYLQPLLPLCGETIYGCRAAINSYLR